MVVRESLISRHRQPGMRRPIYSQVSRDWLESDVEKAVTKSIDVIASGMSSLFSQLRSLMQAEMELEVAAVEKKYDREIERGMPTRRSFWRRSSRR